MIKPDGTSQVKDPREKDVSRRAIGGHHRGHRGMSDDWITPRFIIDALGPFDLDPCACYPQPWATAGTMYSREHDGLKATWRGRVWLNPPYGPDAANWIRKLAKHGTGTALLFARTETKMFFESVWGKASALLFLRGRIHFHYPDGKRASANSGAPSVLIAYGDRDAEALRRCGLDGVFVGAWENTQ